MKKGYILSIDEIKKLPEASDYKSIQKNKEEVEQKVLEIFNENKIINGDKLEKIFFPLGKKYDFFISYSHNDEEIVKRLASFLEEKGFDVFLDSKIWGSADHLLKLIDDNYSRCDHDKNFYDYTKRNFSTSHVHSMLNSAIGKAISKSKYIIFTSLKNNPNYKPSTSDLEVKILSPWIYQELNYFNLFNELQKNINNLYINKILLEDLQIQRSGDTSGLKEISINNLLEEIGK